MTDCREVLPSSTFQPGSGYFGVRLRSESRAKHHICGSRRARSHPPSSARKNDERTVWSVALEHVSRRVADDASRLRSRRRSVVAAHRRRRDAHERNQAVQRKPTLRQAWPRTLGRKGRNVRSTCRCSHNLRITRRRAVSCGLHRPTSQVIHRSGFSLHIEYASFSRLSSDDIRCFLSTD